MRVFGVVSERVQTVGREMAAEGHGAVSGSTSTSSGRRKSQRPTVFSKFFQPILIVSFWLVVLPMSEGRAGAQSVAPPVVGLTTTNCGVDDANPLIWETGLTSPAGATKPTPCL